MPPLSAQPWDHPRSRGVYIQLAVQVVVSWGSSPLARGLRDRDDGPAVTGGIIPARAGFTRSSGPPCRRRRDHPRSRGVYRGQFVGGPGGPGSSPLARGLPSGWRPGRRAARIIPARAGFTRFVFWFCSYVWDHPRSRGVYVGVGATAPDARGSSPLARGLPAALLGLLALARIIPARAGFTRPSHR